MLTGLGIETVRLGIKNIHRHKLRSFLTTLGIICGVAAVICMLSIGEGGHQAQMALIRLLGTENIIVQSVRTEAPNEARSELLEYGLKQADLDRISGTLLGVRRISPLREVGFEVNYHAKRCQAMVVGAEPQLFDIIHINLERGRRLTAVDQDRAAQVCVIGQSIKEALFAYEDPIGACISAPQGFRGEVAFEVVGVLKWVETAGTPAKGAGQRNLNEDVLIPLSTAEKRYGDLRVRVTSGSEEFSRCEYSDFYIQARGVSDVLPVSHMVQQILELEHGTKPDYTVRVPLEQLQIAEAENRRRQITLGCIAGISLLVGGIGIMNIMLATVTERTREIGIRRALGAKRRHITIQFLIEAVVLTTVGGITGIIAGAAGAHIITQWVGWPTVIYEWTILVSFGLAVAVGVFFGIYPAAAAARLDPIEALRHE